MTWQIIEGFLLVAGVLDAVAIALWYACSWPRSQVLGPALVRGPEKGKRIALTFDDGPLPPYTNQVLDILQKHRVRATFFVCGKDVERHPEVVRRIHSEGHTLGNHTWSHPYLYFLSRRKIAEEIDRTQEVVRKAAGQAPRFFRPPYGARWFGLYPLLRERKMELVQWSLDSLDWKLGAEEIMAAARKGLKAGAIILLHDGRQAPGGYLHQLQGQSAPAGELAGRPNNPSPTVEALDAIIGCARAEGFEFASVEEFLSA